MKTRFCPSPTGFMHLGNARTALFSALLAMSSNGRFVLRIEDTDEERSDDSFTKQLMEDLKWLGANWQEGPEAGGEDGPYWQSKRLDIYDNYYKELEAKGMAYECFCTQEQLALSRKLQRASGKPPRYAGTCRALSDEEKTKKRKQGLRPSLRFQIKPKETIQFHDLVKGRQRFNTDDLGDFIIRRSDGTPAFLFCNAIDDSLMGVTHVFRGEDHLTNTPRQLLILKTLELVAPEYGHISLILGPDGGPLSKRHGSRSIKELREEGYLQGALTNYLGRLGHSYENSNYMTIDQLAKGFSVESLGKAPARFDPSQMLHWQKEAIASCDRESLWEMMEVNAIVPEEKKELFLETIAPNITFPKDAIHFANIFFSNGLEYNAEAKEKLSLVNTSFYLSALKVDGFDYKEVCDFLKTNENVSGKSLFQPLRLTLTGEMHGPELKNIFELIGEEEIRNRFNKALEISKNATNL